MLNLSRKRSIEYHSKVILEIVREAIIIAEAISEATATAIIESTAKATAEPVAQVNGKSELSKINVEAFIEAII